MVVVLSDFSPEIGDTQSAGTPYYVSKDNLLVHALSTLWFDIEHILLFQTSNFNKSIYISLFLYLEYKIPMNHVYHAYYKPTILPQKCNSPDIIKYYPKKSKHSCPYKT